MAAEGFDSVPIKCAKCAARAGYDFDVFSARI